MTNLQLVKSEQFGNVTCDFYLNQKKDLCMTREQIGAALGYTEPRIAIAKLHERHKARLNNFSVVTKLTTTDGKAYDTIVYNAKGIYEICRWSQQPKADDFYDWVYDVLETIRTGKAMPDNLEAAKIAVQKKRADAMYLNAQTRMYCTIMKTIDNKNLSPIAAEVFGIAALEEVTGKTIGYRPECERTYSATEIGKMCGVSSQRIGKTANANGLKTDEYGVTVMDKSPYSAKEIPSFRYNERAVARFKEIFNTNK